MRIKRNKLNKSIETEGYIKKYFGNEIGRILLPNTRNLQNCEIPYVCHKEAEDTLAECFIGDSYEDKSLVFTGLTGSGKTTILRHVFGLEENANKSIIKENTIIIPVDFNRSQSSAQDAILSSLRAAVQKIVDTYKIEYPNTINEKFYEYINERRADFLWLNPKHNHETPHKERMEVFLDKIPTAFASCQLQYAMDQSECELQLVVLIVDNIEAFMDSNAKNSKARYLAPVIEAFKLAECIDQRGENTKWCFNMIISCRHHIWRIMKGEFTDNAQENALLQSYITTERPYDLINPIPVKDIIKKREEVFSRKSRNPQKWNVAVEVVNTVLQTMENSISDFVMQLELKDLRKSMSRMQELILHRGLQRQSDDEIDADAFQIGSVEQFDLTRVNLVRTIGLGDRKYYSDLNSVIPNLLFNEQQEGLELFVLLTLQYFLLQCGYAEPAWDNSVSIPEFYDKMKYIFEYSENELDYLFGHSISFLIQHRILLRSADQPQDEVPGLSLEEVKKVEYVYVSGLAVKLWEELGKSSALFQLYIDDIWIDENMNYFGDDGNDIEHCVEYLIVLQKIEKKIFNSAKNNSIHSAESYIEAFGSTPVCKQLGNGLIASLETISVSRDSRLQSRVEMAKKTLKKAKEIFDELTRWEHARQKIIDSM